MERELKELNYDFGPGFKDRVMNEVGKERSGRQLFLFDQWRRPILIATAACLLALVTATLWMEGTVSVDALIGLSDFSEIEISDLISN